MAFTRLRIAGLAAATFCALAGTAVAGEPCWRPPAGAPGADWVPSSVSVQSENDVFVTDLDRYYTNGLQLTAVLGSGCVPDAAAEAMVRHLPGVGARDPKALVVSLGQHMYTPDDKTLSVPDPADRPYAGWLYVSVGAMAEDVDAGVRYDAALDVGVVGPGAGAGPVQNRWHRVIDSPAVHGWGHQLKNEPGVLATLQTQWREPAGVSLFGRDVDVTYGAGLAAGNVLTSANVGGAVRLGTGLAHTYAPPLIRPAPAGAAVMRRRVADGPLWNVVAGIEGRAVARNVFLDGNTGTDGPSVRKRPLVLDARFGVEFLWPSVRLSLTQVVRTREFYAQDDVARFGSISVSWIF